MASKRNYINLLPDEILRMVFDRLDLKSIKSASRTCKRWNSIIFLSGYIDRFAFNVSVFTEALCDEELMSSVIHRVKQLATFTRRRYRNITFVVLLDDYTLKCVWKIIHPITTTDIRQLTIRGAHGEFWELLRMVIDAIPKLPQLQSLSVTDNPGMRNSNRSTNVHQRNIPVIRSKSIEYLTLYCTHKCTINMPQLRTFNGALCALQSPNDSSSPPVFARMKELTVSVKSWTPVDTSLMFQRMPCLETIQWDIPVDEVLFTTIIETYPALTRLQLSAELSLTSLLVLQQLLKLTELRRLSFGCIVVKRNFFFDFSKLTKLEELDLGQTHIMPICLMRLPKTLKTLGLHVNRNNERNLMEIIPRCLTELTELRLLYYGALPSTDVLKALPFLKNLEVLQFSYCEFPQPFFFGLSAPLYRLRILRFVNCKFETFNFDGLQGKFPNVKRTQFVQCPVPQSDGTVCVGLQGTLQGFQDWVTR